MVSKMGMTMQTANRGTNCEGHYRLYDRISPLRASQSRVQRDTAGCAGRLSLGDARRRLSRYYDGPSILDGHDIKFSGHDKQRERQTFKTRPDYLIRHCDNMK